MGVLGRHLQKPAKRHMAAAKHVLRYLKGVSDNGINFTKHGPIQICAYSDSDYASDPDTRRSVTGTIITANDQPLLWTSSRNKSNSHSSTQSELMAADCAARQLVWLSNVAHQLCIPLVKKEPALIISKKPAVKYHDGIIVVDERPDLPLFVDNT